jgi:type VI protein secretion system component Hcp
MYARVERTFGAGNGGLNVRRGICCANRRVMLLIPLVAAWLFAVGTARGQDGGYMRVVTSSGRQMAGESTDPAYLAWIPLRQVTMPTPSEIAALANESNSVPEASAAKSVHRPVVIIKDRDKSSLGLLGAMTAHQHFPEVDVVLTHNDQPITRYKLTDATIISIRGGGTNGGTDAPMEQMRLNYTKIEIEH